MARIDDVLYVDDLTKHSDQFLSISKVGVMAHKGVSIPFSVPVPSTPYKTAFTTPSFSPAHVVSPAQGDRSPFINGNLLHRGFGVKKVLTDYLTIDTEERGYGRPTEGSGTESNIVGDASSAHKTGLEYFELRKDGGSPIRHGAVLEG